MPAKKRKPTSQVRREEAEALKKQLRVLEDQVQSLRARAQEAAMTPQDHLRLLRRSLGDNKLLQGLLEVQQLVVAGAQSELMDFEENQARNPLYSYIHLPKCWEKRRHILVGLKEEKLHAAMQYVLARSQQLDLLTRHSSEHRFEDAEGAFCCNRFEVNHVAGVKSLKEVYKAAKFFLENVEISTTEALGHVTVREDYDTVGDESIGCFRLISARPSGIVTESDKVLYDKFYEHHELLHGRPCAVMVADSIDADDLHPYDPKSRVRLDVSATLVITAARRKRSTRHCVGEDDEELVAIIESAVFMKILSPEIDAPAHTLHAIADGSVSWVRVMLRTIREFIDTP